LAVALANKHRKLAFAIRERGIHKLLVIDPETLDASTATLLEEQSHGTSYFTEGHTPGIIYLQFSPDDKFLVSYGQYGDQKYQIKYWALGWGVDQLIAAKATPEISTEAILNMDVPNPIVFLENPHSKFDLKGTPDNLRAVHFLNNRVVLSEIETKFQKPVGKVIPRTGENAALLTRIDGTAVTTKILFESPYTNKAGQVPIVCSGDGRWLAVADAAGKIQVLNTVIPPEKYLVSSRNDSTSNLDLRYINHADSPACASPVVGMSFAEKLTGTGIVPYLVIASQDGSVQVWSMFEHEERLFRETVNIKK